MKNEKHPIDDLFKHGLHQHHVPPPMHVWERIEEQRGTRHRGKLVLLRSKATILSSAAAVLLLVWLSWPDRPNLGSFPLMMDAALAKVDKITPATEKSKLQLPAQRAGLMPDLPVTPAAANNQQEDQTKDRTPAAIAAVISEREMKIKGIEQGSGHSADNDQGVSTVPPAVEDQPLREQEGTMTFAALDRTAMKVLPTTITGTLDRSPLPIPETGCARFSQGRPAIFFAVTAGPSLPSRTFSAKSEEDVAYAEQRSLTEAVQLSYGASARLSVVFPWGGAIRSGISYSQLNERLTYRNSRVRQTTITEIYGPNGNVIGTDTSYITENTTLKYSNRHRLIDIPFQLGYEVRYNKVTVAANAGVNLNIAYASEGNYLGPQDLLPTRFDSDDQDLEPVYKTEVGLSWQASLGLHYQLNDHLDLMAEPYLRYYPESFTTANYPLNQKYLVGGVGVGLRVLL